jgi:hypothetical protein
MHQTDTLAKNSAGRKGVQDVNGRLERLHRLSILPSEFAKDVCLFLKNIGDGINRVARFELLGKGMAI